MTQHLLPSMCHGLFPLHRCGHSLFILYATRYSAKAHHSHKCTQALSDLRSWVWSHEQRRQSHWSTSRRRRCLCWWQGGGPGNLSACGHTQKNMLTISTNCTLLYPSGHRKSPQRPSRTTYVHNQILTFVMITVIMKTLSLKMSALHAFIT